MRRLKLSQLLFLYKKPIYTYLWVSTLVIISLSESLAQRNTSFQSQFWSGYIAQYRLNTRFGIWFDGHLRFRDDADVNLTIVRFGVIYFISDQVRLMGGHSWIQFQPTDNNQTLTNEHRPWYQIWWRTTYDRIVLTQWLRHELRYVQQVQQDVFTGDYMFTQRTRFNIYAQVPINKVKLAKGTWFLALHNELFTNMGRNIVYNIFDQNRFFVGLGYQPSASLQIQVGYLNVLQQRAAPNAYVHIDALRVFLFHNVDWRKKVVKP